MKTIVASLCAVIMTASAAAAAPAKHNIKATHVKLVCPVTGQTIDSIKDAAGSSTYKGKTYYFCCSGCKPLFDKNPAKYIKSASAKNFSAMPKM